MDKQINGQFNSILFSTQIIIINQNKYYTLFLQLLYYKLQYNMYAVTSPSNNFAITK